MVKYKFRLANVSAGEQERIIEIEVEPNDTVLEVKDKIRKEFNILGIFDIQLIWKEESES